ncbi:MAG: D-alanyl-D-alanine carboxypeptidase [Clostridia bacterium]|nr:D-alanyl-D-alanine carboxypeptidase [Clostridia bacterium]
MKKLTTLLLTAVLILCVSMPASAYWVKGKAAILIDVSTQKVLYAQQEHNEYPASAASQIMTALVALEKGDLQQQIKMPDKYTSIGNDSIYLAKGEMQTLENLLYALLMRTANDAGYAIAVSLAGSEEKYVEWMNEKAAELGMKDTHYVNVNGLYDENGHTSAADLATLTMAAMQDEVFAKIVATSKYEIPWESNDSTRILYNKNQFLTSGAGITGVKMGYNAEAGTCLVTTATRYDHKLLGVILNSEGVYHEMDALLNFGLNKYKWVQVGKADEVLSNMPVLKGREKNVNVVYDGDAYIVFEKGKEEEIKGVMELFPQVTAPVKAGDKVGTMTFTTSTGEVQVLDLVSAAAVERYTLWQVLDRVFSKIFGAFTTEAWK